jgi:hypothetical protein
MVRRFLTAAAVAGLMLAGASDGLAQGGMFALSAGTSSDAADAALVPRVSSLAESVSNAIATAEADAAARNLSPTDAQAAIMAAIQNVIAASGESPRIVESALVAVRRCPTGIAVSTENLSSASNLIAVHCVQALGKPLSNPSLLALGSVEDTVLALLESDVRPAALGGGSEQGGGLDTPPSGGLASGGGSDYLP